MSHDSLVTKPASGHWTDAYPELGRGPVSLEDCVSEEFYEKEREHVFRKTWLYIGRVERVPKSGSYFTRELRFLNTSIIIVRGKDDVIRAFHNICPHRGNKMLWEDDPFQEVSGPRAAAVLPLPRLALQAGRLAALRDAQGSAARFRRRQLPGARHPVRGLGRVHLHQPQPAQHRVGAVIPRRVGAGHRGLSVRGAASGLPIQGRTAVQLEDLPRRLRGELPRALSARVVVRRSDRGGQRCVRPTEPVHRRTGVPAQGSASDVLVLRRAVAEDAVLQADRVRHRGQRGRTVEQADRPRADAAGNQSHPVGEVRLRLVSSSSPTSC